jgi:hypothetical protein
LLLEVYEKGTLHRAVGYRKKVDGIQFYRPTRTDVDDQMPHDDGLGETDMEESEEEQRAPKRRREDEEERERSRYQIRKREAKKRKRDVDRRVPIFTTSEDEGEEDEGEGEGDSGSEYVPSVKMAARTTKKVGQAERTSFWLSKQSPSH